MAATEFGFVYFLDAASVNRIKIGTGICPENRLQAIRLMCPVPTELIGIIPGGKSKEAELHQKYADLRRHGEWFEGTPNLRNDIDVLCLMSAWNKAGQSAREEFLCRIDRPLMDARYA